MTHGAGGEMNPQSPPGGYGPPAGTANPPPPDFFGPPARTPSQPPLVPPAAPTSYSRFAPPQPQPQQPQPPPTQPNNAPPAQMPGAFPGAQQSPPSLPPSPFASPFPEAAPRRPPGSFWTSEEIAERNRRALTPERPPGAKDRPRRSDALRRGPRRIYVKHNDIPQEIALEPYVPWSSFFAFTGGISVAWMADTLAPFGLFLAVASSCLGIYALYSSFRSGIPNGRALSGAGVALAILFSVIHYTAYTKTANLLAPLDPLLNQTAAKKPDAEILTLIDFDFRLMDKAFRRYGSLNGQLPPWSRGNLGANKRVPPTSSSFQIPTFRIHQFAYDKFNALTTPVPILDHYLRDPFASSVFATYSYYCPDSGAAAGTAASAPAHPNTAIIMSPGPDGEYQIDPERDFVPGSAASRDTLLRLRWDPTNGLVSGGDIWFVFAPVREQEDPGRGVWGPGLRIGGGGGQ